MDTINDQENIQRILDDRYSQQVDSRTRMILKTGPDARADEWEQIRSEMEAGSPEGATKADVSTIFSDDKSSMASILHELRKELQIQGDALAGYEKQDWDEEAEYVTQGWCEALQFAIKLIEGHNES